MRSVELRNSCRACGLWFCMRRRLPFPPQQVRTSPGNSAEFQLWAPGPGNGMGVPGGGDVHCGEPGTVETSVLCSFLKTAWQLSSSVTSLLALLILPVPMEEGTTRMASARVPITLRKALQLDGNSPLVWILEDRELERKDAHLPVLSFNTIISGILSATSSLKASATGSSFTSAEAEQTLRFKGHTSSQGCSVERPVFTQSSAL